MIFIPCDSKSKEKLVTPLTIDFYINTLFDNLWNLRTFQIIQIITSPIPYILKKAKLTEPIDIVSESKRVEGSDWGVCVVGGR